MPKRRLLAGLGAVLVLTGGCGMDRSAANKQIVSRMIDARKFDRLDQLVAAEVHRRSGAAPGLRLENLEQFKAFLRQDAAAVPDALQQIAFLLAEDDLVAANATYPGTQQGAFGSFPPSGRRFELPFIAVLRLEAGKVTEMWVEWDNLRVLGQLGHFPPPAAALAATRFNSGRIRPSRTNISRCRA